MAEVRGVAKATMRRLAWSSVVAFAVYGAGAGVTYLSQLLIARSIGPQSYGIFAYVTAWITILAYLAALGFDVSLLRLVPAYKTYGAWNLVRGVIRYAERRSAAIGCGIVLVGWTITLVLRGRLQWELTQTFLVGFAIVPVLALLWIRAAVVRAFGGVISALAPDRLVRDSLLLIFICWVFFGGWGQISAPVVMTAMLVSALVGLGLVTWTKRRLWPVAIDGDLSIHLATNNPTAEWRRTAFPLVAIAVAEAAINRTGIVALGWGGYTSDAGIYALIFNVTSVVVLPRIAVNTRFAPMVSEFFARGDHAGLQNLITKGASWTLIGAACMAVPLFFLARPILAWFGPGFDAAVTPMQILLLSQVIAASAGSQIFLLTMTGHERSAAVVVVLAALGNFALTIPLIHLYGTTGAAIANAATLLLWNVAMAIIIYRRLGAVPGVLAIFFGRNSSQNRPRISGTAINPDRGLHEAS
jgi:O-antigen/teichoic acid export membrane protein